MSIGVQRTLFADPPEWPQGFRYQAEFLTSGEEAMLVAELSRLEYRPFEFRGVLAKRHVAYFGWSYDFATNRLAAVRSIPSFLLPIRDKAAAFAGLSPEALGHVLINQYPEGAAIGWHRDKPQFADVLGISLGAPAPLRMRRRGLGAWERRTIVAEPRSIYLLRGVARTQWEHSVPPVAGHRYSITFRSLTEAATARLPIGSPA